MNAKLPKLENWSFVDSAYTAPEHRKLHLQGEVHGDKRFKDGNFVRTSHVLEFLPDVAPLTALTRHTRYRLGKIDPEFSQWMTTEGLVLEGYKKPFDVYSIT
jgi:hypothetical protein